MEAAAPEEAQRRNGEAERVSACSREAAIGAKGRKRPLFAGDGERGCWIEWATADSRAALPPT